MRLSYTRCSADANQESRSSCPRMPFCLIPAIVTNEFVAMGQISGEVTGYARHYQAVLTVFLTSFANFGTLGMIIGCFKGLVDKERNDLVAKNVGRMLLSGILVSLMSAGIVGIFVW
ncbi:nucleoside transporter C-terminal domain-containing protein [Actinomyces israelii]|uniref:nucleoside transporter C-terminal domain-containing protein n=1 Tax=Actinomyces israelii TaxID=1659 RepID=UPI001E39D365|nr:nucleoside transporter C-terminal domain-containing protein [Actinomyces israelii]